MSNLRSLGWLVALCGLAVAAVPVHAQGQGKGQGQSESQGEGRGQSESQGQSEGKGQSEDRGQSEGKGQGVGQGNGRATSVPGRSEEDFALEAVRNGRALPLADILATARQSVAGEVIDARLVTIRGILVYEVKSMTGDGHVSRSYYYARSGRKVTTD